MCFRQIQVRPICSTITSNHHKGSESYAQWESYIEISGKYDCSGFWMVSLCHSFFHKYKQQDTWNPIHKAYWIHLNTFEAHQWGDRNISALKEAFNIRNGFEEKRLNGWSYKNRRWWLERQAYFGSTVAEHPLISMINEQATDQYLWLIMSMPAIFVWKPMDSTFFHPSRCLDVTIVSCVIGINIFVKFQKPSGISQDE